MITSNHAFDELIKRRTGKPIAKGENVLAPGFNEARLQRFKALYSRAFSGETFTEIEYTDSPAEFWSEISYYPIRKGEEVIGTACFARDITEKKKAEKLIKDERILLRTLVDNLPINIYTKDVRSRKTLANRADYEFMGATREEDVLGKDDSEFFSPEQVRKVRREEQRLFTTGEPIINEEERHTRKGRDVWFLKSKIPLRNEDNQIIGLVGISYDITSRKEIEEQIKNSEEKRRLIMNAAIDAIICIDVKGVITFWNPQAEKVFGWKASEAIGRLLSDLIIPEPYRERHIQGLENYLKTGTGPVLNLLLELSAINRENKQFPIELTILPIKQGQDEFFCGFIRDITERTNALQAIKTQNAKLREIAWTQSHSVRAPLARIMGLTNLLIDHSLRKEDSTEIINHLVNSSKELDEVIRAIVRRTEQVEIEEANLKISPTTPP